MSFFKNMGGETKEKMVTLVLGGFGLVAALAWNDAIQSIFSALLPDSGGIVGKILYAVLVTVIVVLISRELAKISEEKR